jgi:peroxiredoxin
VIACGRPAAKQTPTSAVLAAGTSAPDFSAVDIDGNPVSLSSHLGKDVVLLDFCSTWCEPCIAELPHLRALYESNKERGFLVVAISLDGPETVQNVAGLARRNQLTFPMVIDGDARISSLYNPKRTAPVTVLIDRSGKIIAIREGYTSGDEEPLAVDVARALDEWPPFSAPHALR